MGEERERRGKALMEDGGGQIRGGGRALMEGVVVEVTKKRGWLSVFWERGSPDLPACGPRRG